MWLKVFQVYCPGYYESCVGPNKETLVYHGNGVCRLKPCIALKLRNLGQSHSVYSNLDKWMVERVMRE